jgi:putative Ca2+/H+ antiporter (TMEM165/GDT1 family)
MAASTKSPTGLRAPRYPKWLCVVAGTTFGMMLANMPVVWLGERITRRIPLRLVSRVSAAIFLGLRITALAWG